jgi:hypothetical protein
MANATTEERARVAPKAREKLQCGIVMPIAAMADYSESHWLDVLDIIKDAVAETGLEANVVSYTEESSLIHSTIVQNLYDNPIVVCDVSGKNPNVMFELGLRLAFDKPTIIIKDDQTGYSFDTGNIEHLSYPRDLRFAKIVDFKNRLSEKINATLEKAETDPNYSTFLKHFKRITVSKLEDKEVTSQEFILNEIKAIRQDVLRMNRSFSPPLSLRRRQQLDSTRPHTMSFLINDMPEDIFEVMCDEIAMTRGVKKLSITQDSNGRRVNLEFDESASPVQIDHIVEGYKARLQNGDFSF